MASLIAVSEKFCRWLADAAGFAVLEEGKVRGALRKMIYLSAGAWLLGLLSLTGLISPVAGLLLMTAVISVLAGAVLIGAHIQQELTTIAVNATPQSAQPLPAMPELEALAALVASSQNETGLPQAQVKPVAAKAGKRVVLHSGDLEGRNYEVFIDGSIEIDTAVGRRWFESVDHAHEFIGLGRANALKKGRIELASVA